MAKYNPKLVLWQHELGIFQIEQRRHVFKEKVTQSSAKEEEKEQFLIFFGF